MEKKFKIKIIITIIIIISISLCGIIVFLINYYKVDEIKVEGNYHYTSKEIEEMILENKFSNNTLYLFIKYKKNEVGDIPFIEKMDVKIESHNKIKIIVYEKSLAGCVEFLGSYLYFDKDGVVVESQNVKSNKVPLVTGLEFDSIVLNEKLPIDNEEMFWEILNITQVLNKNEIHIDEMCFDLNYNVNLVIDDVKILLGNMENLEYKIIQLREILPEISEKKGVLNLGNFNENSKTISFKEVE